MTHEYRRSRHLLDRAIRGRSHSRCAAASRRFAGGLGRRVPSDVVRRHFVEVLTLRRTCTPWRLLDRSCSASSAVEQSCDDRGVLRVPHAAPAVGHVDPPVRRSHRDAAPGSRAVRSSSIASHGTEPDERPLDDSSAKSSLGALPDVYHVGTCRRHRARRVLRPSRLVEDLSTILARHSVKRGHRRCLTLRRSSALRCGVTACDEGEAVG